MVFTMEERTIIKVPLTLQEAGTITTEAKQAGKSRGEYCREILIKHLQGHQEGPPGPREDHEKDLEDARRTIEGLQRAYEERGRDLEWTRGQLATTTEALHRALEKIPAAPAMITDGIHKPWWQFWK